MPNMNLGDGDFLGWKPVDMIMGGMLTAGVAVGIYKLGLSGLGRQDGIQDATNRAMDGIDLQNCIAIAGKPCEMEMSVFPNVDDVTRRLSESLQQVMGSPQGHRGTFRSDGDGESITDFSPKRKRSPMTITRQWCQQEMSSTQLNRLRKEQIYAEEKLEEAIDERIKLKQDLQTTQQLLEEERLQKKDLEKSQKILECQVSNLEKRLELLQGDKPTNTKSWTSLLEQQVKELEEQLEQVYRDNSVIPKLVAQRQQAEHRELTQSLIHAEELATQQQQDISQLEQQMSDLTVQLAKAKHDGRKLGEDNVRLSTEARKANTAARELLTHLYNSSDMKDFSEMNLSDLLRAAENELSLEQLLLSVRTLL